MHLAGLQTKEKKKKEERRMKERKREKEGKKTTIQSGRSTRPVAYLTALYCLRHYLSNKINIILYYKAG
jgi:hypothetical protein